VSDLQVVLSPEELTAIDDFRFKRRMADPVGGSARRPDEIQQLWRVQPRSGRTHPRLRSGSGGVT
jgi:hypothetical protein